MTATDVKIPVFIIGCNLDTKRRLKSDLEKLGFLPVSGTYPYIDFERLKNQFVIILLEFTEYGDDAASIGRTLAEHDLLTPETSVVAIMSEKTIGHIPVDDMVDDIIRYPYNIAELDYRLHRLAHLHQQEPADDTVRVGNISLSPSRYQVEVDGRPVMFSFKEYEIFRFLITHPNLVFTRQQLLENIWPDNATNRIRTIDVHIRRIRVKIGDTDSRYIQTVRGVGYTFRVPD